MRAIPIELDKQRNVRLDIIAVTLIEREMQTDIFKLDLSDMKFTDYLVLLWAGLLHEDKDLTKNQVVEIANEHSDVPAIVRAVSDAFRVAFNLASEDEEGNEKAPKKKVGKSST